MNGGCGHKTLKSHVKKIVMICYEPWSGPAITAHGSLDVKQENQIQICVECKEWVTGGGDSI
jgi:hypothetical protein